MDTIYPEISEIKQILKELALSQKDTDAKFKETDAKFKETDKRIIKAFELFEGQWGKLIESLVEGDLVNLLKSKNIDIHETSLRRKGSNGGENYEFDIIAHNGHEIVIVEVKTTMKVKDVDNFISKLKKARQWMSEYKDYKVYGAVAFLRAQSGSDAYAESKKLFVIKATGNSAAIINHANFVPAAF